MSTAVTHHGKIRKDRPTTYYEEVARLPGYGDAPDRCRPMKPVGFCEEGHTILGRSSCGTRYCPDHWRDWIEEAVINMVARLAAYRETREGAEKRLCHVVASPPQDRRYGVRELWETRSDAYDALEAAGVRGAAVVTHPYRTNDRGDALYSTARDHGEVEEGTGKWEFLRDMSDDWDELTEHIEAAPHYHTLGAVEDVDGAAAPEGWVVENVRSFSRFHYNDKEAYRDMAAAAYYVLTHGGVQDNRSTTTYFGEIHPNAFNPEEELTAAVWSKIQQRAEQAVKEEPTEGASKGHRPEECPREECEAVVCDVVHLPDFLDDGDAVSRVLSHRDGRARLARLRGMLAWWGSRTDRPPPGKLRSKARFREWLRDRGEVLTPEPSQVSIETAVMSS